MAGVAQAVEEFESGCVLTIAVGANTTYGLFRHVARDEEGRLTAWSKDQQWDKQSASYSQGKNKKNLKKN